MPHVKSMLDTVIRTTIGHTIEVKADTPTYVPPEVLKFAPMFGCAECTETGELVRPPAAKPKKRVPLGEIVQLTVEEQADPKLRAEVVKAAVAKLYQDGNTDDFTIADHQPKVKSVERLVGFSVSGTEVSSAVQLFEAE